MPTKTLLAIGHLTALAFSTVCGNGGESATASPTAAIEAPFEVAPGVLARREEPPAPPLGAEVLSDYFVFETAEDSALVVGIPLTASQQSTQNLGFYTHDGIAWAGTKGAISLVEGGTVLEGVFPNVPPNVIVLQLPE